MTAGVYLVNPRLHAVMIESEDYEQLYHFLSRAYSASLFNDEDVQEICNLFFNLATGGSYRLVAEKELFNDRNLTLEERCNELGTSEYAEVCKYISINCPFFLSMLLRCLFEWDVSTKIKSMYLLILEQMFKSSLSNAGVCSRVTVSAAILFHLRLGRTYRDSPAVSEV